MVNKGIPANAHNKVVAGENAKSVNVVYSTIVEEENTDIAHKEFIKWVCEEGVATTLVEKIFTIVSKVLEHTDSKVSMDGGLILIESNDSEKCVLLTFNDDTITIEGRLSNAQHTATELCLNAPIISEQNKVGHILDKVALTLEKMAGEYIDAVAETLRLVDLANLFNDMMRHNIKNDFSKYIANIRKLSDDFEPDKMKEITHTFNYQRCYREEWRDFAVKMGEDCFRALAFYNSNQYLFIDNDIIHYSYLKELAAAYKVEIDINGDVCKLCPAPYMFVDENGVELTMNSVWNMTVAEFYERRPILIIKGKSGEYADNYKRGNTLAFFPADLVNEWVKYEYYDTRFNMSFITKEDYIYTVSSLYQRDEFRYSSGYKMLDLLIDISRKLDDEKYDMYDD